MDFNPNVRESVIFVLVLQHLWFGGGSLLCGEQYPKGLHCHRIISFRVSANNLYPIWCIFDTAVIRTFSAWLWSFKCWVIGSGPSLADQPPSGHVFTCFSVINQHRPTQFCLHWACAQHVYTCLSSAHVFMCWLFHPSDTEVFRECAT